MVTFVMAAVLLTVLALLFLLPPLVGGADGMRRRARHDAANLAVLRDQARELDADRAAGLISGAAHAAARA
ncbi:MAG TPA: c-type cytochrome biogenesis protein CcmI, partial [Telluria sp.]